MGGVCGTVLGIHGIHNPYDRFVRGVGTGRGIRGVRYGRHSTRTGIPGTHDRIRARYAIRVDVLIHTGATRPRRFRVRPKSLLPCPTRGGTWRSLCLSRLVRAARRLFFPSTQPSALPISASDVSRLAVFSTLGFHASSKRQNPLLLVGQGEWPRSAAGMCLG